MSLEKKDGVAVGCGMLRGAVGLKALPCSNTPPASCTPWRLRQTPLHVVPHQQCSQPWVSRPWREVQRLPGETSGCTLPQHTVPGRRTWRVATDGFVFTLWEAVVERGSGCPPTRRSAVRSPSLPRLNAEVHDKYKPFTILSLTHSKSSSICCIKPFVPIRVL